MGICVGPYGGPGGGAASYERDTPLVGGMDRWCAGSEPVSPSTNPRDETPPTLTIRESANRLDEAHARDVDLNAINYYTNSQKLIAFKSFYSTTFASLCSKFPCEFLVD